VSIAEGLRHAVWQTDKGRCAYCLTSEANSGIPLTIDHIRPMAKGGGTVLDNLCLACRTCNEFKSDQVSAFDPLTGQEEPLFHPRTQQWAEHFRWSSDGTQVEGLTAIGRATVLALRMNRPPIVSARRRWVWGGWHPPEI
jgi:hypothetical protein